MSTPGDESGAQLVILGPMTIVPFGKTETEVTECPRAAAVALVSSPFPADTTHSADACGGCWV